MSGMLGQVLQPRSPLQSTRVPFFPYYISYGMFFFSFWWQKTCIFCINKSHISEPASVPWDGKLTGDCDNLYSALENDIVPSE